MGGRGSRSSAGAAGGGASPGTDETEAGQAAQASADAAMAAEGLANDALERATTAKQAAKIVERVRTERGKSDDALQKVEDISGKTAANRGNPKLRQEYKDAQESNRMATSAALQARTTFLRKFPKNAKLIEVPE